ncbi:unnamed protein product [Ascophyllum nodosum]
MIDRNSIGLCDIFYKPLKNPSRPFEKLCQRVRGVVVESKHPYPKGVRQDAKVSLPGENDFFLAFDAASNAAAEVDRVTLQELNAGEPRVFSVRGPYSRDPSEEARLPGVNGEPPLRVKGSFVVTFSASHWRGVVMAGEDYGWRLVSFTTDGGTLEDARKCTSEAEMAAEREEVVDTFNSIGYLLSLDADPNSAHTSGGRNTPLHEAAKGGSLPIVQLLLEASANVHAANSHGDLPLHVACRGGRVDIARRLLARDSDRGTVAARNDAGLRPPDVVRGYAALALMLERVKETAGNGFPSRVRRSLRKASPDLQLRDRQWRRKRSREKTQLGRRFQTW